MSRVTSGAPVTNPQARGSPSAPTGHTPSDIDIYTATADYEMPLAGGELGAGAKFAKVVSDNTFDAFLLADDSESRTWNPGNSNVFFAQNAFTLPADVKLEVSGFLSGPGLWGGTFETQAMGALNFGLQRKFLADQLKVRLAADDVFFTQPWRATSEFDGIFTRGGGNWDSRRVSVSLTYDFGNDKVKVRQRETGLDDAAGRVGGGNG